MTMERRLVVRSPSPCVVVPSVSHIDCVHRATSCLVTSPFECVPRDDSSAVVASAGCVSPILLPYWIKYRRGNHQVLFSCTCLRGDALKTPQDSTIIHKQ